MDSRTVKLSVHKMVSPMVDTKASEESLDSMSVAWMVSLTAPSMVL